jgi:DNA-binding CsgD family transcriptional regulator
VVAGLEGVLGLVCAWTGDPAQAVHHFATAEAARKGTGVRAPSLYWWRAEYVEALVEAGQPADALSLLDAWELDARRLDLTYLLAQVARCRGLLAAARGEVDVAVDVLQRAVAQSEAAGDAFGRARAALALGITLRRARQRRAAREVLDAAVHAFSAMGADGWAATARAEVGRIGGRTDTHGLTPAERRVAALVAEGRTNREVAAALFLGERTVETHLTHVYGKLGVRSRAALVRVYRDSGQSSGDSAMTR